MEFLAIGLAAGLLSGLFGIGGGVVIVPALIPVARMKPETATGTSLAFHRSGAHRRRER
jgi:hypothetical protein